MRTFAIANQKGGVAKTTSTYNIATLKALKNKRVLMVDLDPQASLTVACGMYKDDRGNKDITGIMSKTNIDPMECAYQVDATELENLFIIPSHLSLATREMSLITMPAREKRLKKALDVLAGYFDFCFIDCPPQLSILLTNALVASDGVLIPCKTDYLSWKGLNYLIGTINGVQADKDLNPELEISGIFGTLFEKNVKDQQDILALIQDFQGIPFLGAVKKSVDTSREIYKGLPVVLTHKSCQVSLAYKEIERKIK